LILLELDATIYVTYMPKYDLHQKNALFFGRRISRLRKERGLSQVEMARRLGVNQCLVSKWERNRRRIHAAMVVRLAALLGVKTERLLGITESPDPIAAPSLRFLRRANQIAALPRKHQDAIIAVVDRMIRESRTPTQKP
jgi:transcriptional regulator with XRE-family HTH domain